MDTLLSLNDKRITHNIQCFFISFFVSFLASLLSCQMFTLRVQVICHLTATKYTMYVILEGRPSAPDAPWKWLEFQRLVGFYRRVNQNACTTDSGSDSDSPLISSFHRQGCVLSVVCAHPPRINLFVPIKIPLKSHPHVNPVLPGIWQQGQKKKEKNTSSGIHFLLLGHKAELLFSLWWCQQKVLQAAAILLYSLF